MIQLLTKLFIKDYKNISRPSVREAYGTMASFVGIFCNVVLFSVKLLAGWITSSVSITADAVNNLSDASSSIISLIGFRLSGKPADRQHPFGHARGEYVSAMMVAVLILFIGFELVKTSLEKVIHPVATEFSILAVVILCFSVLLKLWMSLFNKKIGKVINSNILLATSQDSINDVYTTSAVLASVLVARYTGLALDGFMGLAVAAYIIFSGIKLLRDTLSPLLGEAPDAELVRSIQAKVQQYDGILGTHDLMVHNYGPGRCFASVHAEVDAAQNILVSHEIIDKIERDFAADDGIHLIIHLDPIVTDDETVNQMHTLVNQTVKSINSQLSIHDLRVVQGATSSNLIFDVVVPPDFPMKDCDLAAEIDERIGSIDKQYHTVITIDSSYVSMPSRKPV